VFSFFFGHEQACAAGCGVFTSSIDRKLPNWQCVARLKASLCQHPGFPMGASGLNQREFVLHICFGAGLISV
jgi:hypothetical protein